MVRRALTTLALLAAASAPAQPPNTDPLQFLIDTAHKYADATGWYLEYTTGNRQTSERYSHSDSSSIVSAEAAGNRYHFEVSDHTGFALVVSDGATEWQLNEPMGQYVTHAPGTYGHPFASSITAGEPQAREAFYARNTLGLLGARLKSAHWQPDDTVVIDGHKIQCYVVTFGTDDYPPSPPLRRTIPGSFTETHKIWIDKDRRLIVKTEQTRDELLGKQGSPYAITRLAVFTIVYTTVSLNEPAPEQLFTFTPPADATLVARFSDPYNGTVTDINPRKPAALPNYVGQPAPALMLTAADGKTLDVATLRGHPVLLDLWATWCGPCLLEMPTLNRISRFAGRAGLALITVDQDKNPADALDYLKREHYNWPNYHDGFDGKYHQLGLKMERGLPSLMLVDASGKIVYYHEGADDEPGLIAAVKALGPEFAAAMAESQK